MYNFLTDPIQRFKWQRTKSVLRKLYKGYFIATVMSFFEGILDKVITFIILVLLFDALFLFKSC